jgi:RNA polymerase-binding transcription factor
MSPADTERFRALLLEERRRVSDAIEYLRQNPAAQANERDETVPDNDVSGAPTVAVEREIDSTLEENEIRTLGAIDTALHRIEAGTFGKCSSCGREIGEDRLAARPYATLCIDCQRKQERA